MPCLLSQGATKEQLNQFTAIKYYKKGDAGASSSNSNAAVEDELCTICNKNYETGDKLMTLPCGHVFHYECGKKKLEEKRTCPLAICRHDITKNVRTVF